ncbi:MAG: T9SS type A sorting domain-containing protein [Saprospiraceae bacterium]|nr:T9SS type A sorting domain-containing protein [Saprospiraceae bacterium]
MKNAYSNTLIHWTAVALFVLFPGPLLTAQFSVDIAVVPVSCFNGNNGSALANVSGGNPPYSFTWSNGQTAAQITDLTAGAYFVTVADATGQTVSGGTNISQPPVLGVIAYASAQLCDVFPDGLAIAVPYGGTPPYNYLWSNGISNAQNNGLTAGTYTITVTDGLGCTTSTNATVIYNAEGLWLSSHSTDASCGLSNGTAEIAAMSGAPPYSYLWSTGAINSEITDLSPGEYTVTVVDANGCSSDATAIVGEVPLFVMAPSITLETCLNAHDGAIDLQLSGGQPPFNILWSTGETSEQITQLAAGVYSVTVSDTGGCSMTETLWVSNIYNGSCGDTATAIIDSCLSCPIFIPDDGVIQVPIHVSCALNDDLSNPAQGLCAVHLKFEHEYLGDLTARLISPAGLSIGLLGPVGLFGPTDFSLFDLMFVPCSSPAAPDPGVDSVWTNNYDYGFSSNYTGNYYPNEGCLEGFNAGTVNGIWILEITDNQAVDVGNLLDVDLIFCDDAAIDSCGGNTALMVSATFSYQVSGDTIYCFGNMSNQSGFIWEFDNGSQTSVLVNPVFLANGPGSYPITLTAWNAADTVYANAVVEIVASSEHNTAAATTWQLSPNPFSDQLMITETKGPGGRHTGYILMSLLGRPLRRGILLGNRAILDTRDLPSGTYYICIESEDGREVRKAVKY